MSDTYPLSPHTQDSEVPDDREVQVLEVIQNHDTDAVAGSSVTPEPAEHHPTQRDIAHAVGLSLGMTNAILKRLAAKGLVMMKRINGRNVHYLVTPDGIDQIARRSYRYLRRTVGHIVRYKERLRAYCAEQKAAGAQGILLIGESDLDFLVEWCAEEVGMAYEHRYDTEQSATPADTPDVGQFAGAHGSHADAQAGTGDLAGNIVLLSEQFDSDAIEALKGKSSGPVPLADLLAGRR